SLPCITGYEYAGYSFFGLGGWDFPSSDVPVVPDLALIGPASELVGPSPPALFESRPDCLPPSRMQCGCHGSPLQFSSEHESRGDRLLSSSPPLTECPQMSV